MLQPTLYRPKFSAHQGPGESSMGRRGIADWNKFDVDQIPSSLELHPAIEPYLKPESRILDLGCGFGKTVLGLFMLGYHHIVGVDSHKEAVNAANIRSAAITEEPRPVFINAAAQHLPFADGIFDNVITQAFWTAIPDGDRQKVMEEAVRVLKPGAPLYMSDFQQTWDNPIYKERYEKGIEQGHKPGTFDVKDATGHVEYLAHHFSQPEVVTLMQDAGLEKPEVLLSPKVKTRSGNVIKGIVAIARKAAGSRKGTTESRQQLL